MGDIIHKTHSLLFYLSVTVLHVSVVKTDPSPSLSVSRVNDEFGLSRWSVVVSTDPRRNRDTESSTPDPGAQKKTRSCSPRRNQTSLSSAYLLDHDKPRDGQTTIEESTCSPEERRTSLDNSIYTERFSRRSYPESVAIFFFNSDLYRVRTEGS